jgi:hypothetical protein
MPNRTGVATMIPPAPMFTSAKRSSATPGKSELVAVVAASAVPISARTAVMFVAQLSFSVHAPEAITGRFQNSPRMGLTRRPPE